MTAKTVLKKAIHSVAQLFAEPATGPVIPTRRRVKLTSEVVALATGLRPLDRALGYGGLPHSSIVELMGGGTPMASGGTTIIAAKIAAKVQRRQGTVAIIDLNHSFDPWQAERCGLVAPHLLLTRPGTLLETLSSLENAARTADLVVVVMGVPAELLEHVERPLRKNLLGRLNTIVRAAPGVFLFVTSPKKNDPFSPNNYPAGFPLAHAATVRLWLQDDTFTFADGVTTAYKASLTVIKNDLALAGKGANIRVKLGSS